MRISDWSSDVCSSDLEAETDDFVTFIRHYWSSLQGATRERDLYRSLRGAITEPGRAVAFAEDVTVASEWYAALLDPGNPLWSDYPDMAAPSKNGRASCRESVGKYMVILGVSVR